MSTSVDCVEDLMIELFSIGFFPSELSWHTLKVKAWNKEKAVFSLTDNTVG